MLTSIKVDVKAWREVDGPVDVRVEMSDFRSIEHPEILDNHSR
jgi:hypothetical protein